MANKPVVFVPGFPASELWRIKPERMLFPFGLDDIGTPKKRKDLVDALRDVSSPPSIEARQPIRRVLMVAKQAESLYDVLRKFGYSTSSKSPNFRAVGWDWRLAVDDAGVKASVKRAISDLHAVSGAKVVVVAHSTGGLVIRELVENDKGLAAKVDCIVAFGVPWAGTLKALRYLTDGEPIGFLTAQLSAEQVRSIMRVAQAAYDLAPPDPAQTKMTTSAGIPLDLVVDPEGRQVSPLKVLESSSVAELKRGAKKANRLASRPWTLESGVAVINICGWGTATETRCVIEGDAFSYATSHEGDGTAPYVSASWLRGPKVRTLSIPIGVTITDQIPDRHAQLWNCEPVESILRDVLERKKIETHVFAAADNDDSLNPNSPVRIRIAASSGKGEPLPDARATLHLASNDRTTTAIQGTRHEMLLIRGTNTKANFGSRYFRFRIDVDWTGGLKELPLMIRV